MPMFKRADAEIHYEVYGSGFPILLYAPGTQVLSVVMLKMWSGGKPEDVSVIGLLMVVLVIVFRWIQLRLIKTRISTL